MISVVPHPPARTTQASMPLRRSGFSWTIGSCEQHMNTQLKAMPGNLSVQPSPDTVPERRRPVTVDAHREQTLSHVILQVQSSLKLPLTVNELTVILSNV